MIAAQKKQLGIEPTMIIKGGIIVMKAWVKAVSAIAGDKCKRSCDWRFPLRRSGRRQCKCQCVADNPGTTMPPKLSVASCASEYGVVILPWRVENGLDTSGTEPFDPLTQKASINPILPLLAIGAGLTLINK